LQISIVADELSGDPETAFEIGLEWDVSRFELRGVHDQRVPRLSAHARRRLVQAVKSFGVTITAISPGLFKIPFPADQPGRSNLGWMDEGFFRAWSDQRELLRDHVENLLPESLDFAAEIGAGFVIVFSFHRAGAAAGSAPAGVADTLAQAAEAASERGLTLLVETEEGHWANSGALTADLLQRVGHPALAANWDPANALIEGDVPYPAGYEAVRRHVRNVHFKDVVRHPDGSWEIAAQGQVDWRGQIAALKADGYDGAIAVEPHLSPSVASTRNALRRLRDLIGSA
jgi:sugar phosphate isomerase/epimerase